MMMGYEQLGSGNSKIKKSCYLLNLGGDKKQEVIDLTFSYLVETYFKDVEPLEDFVVLYDGKLYYGDVEDKILKEVKQPLEPNESKIIDNEKNAKQYKQDLKSYKDYLSLVNLLKNKSDQVKPPVKNGDQDLDLIDTVVTARNPFSYFYDSVQYLGKRKKKGIPYREGELLADQLYSLCTEGLHTPVIFYKEKNRVVFCNVVKAFQFQMAVQLLTERGVITPEDHVIAGIDGLGAMENHIVTVYSNPVGNNKEELIEESDQEQRQWQIFDSKTVSLRRFFAEPGRFNLRDFFKALWLAITPKPRDLFDQTVTVNVNTKEEDNVSDKREVDEEKQTSILSNGFVVVEGNNKTLPNTNIIEVHYDYYSLGTQSFFDTVSCGYHTARHIQVIEKMVSENKDVTRANILKEVKSPVQDVAIELAKDEHCQHKVQVVSMKYRDYLKIAWQDSIQTLEEDKANGFQHYFLGWPSEPGIGRRIAYFLTLAFILKPLGSIIRLAGELLPNFLAQTAHFLKNSLIAWAPKSPFTQYLRTALLPLSYLVYGVFKLAALLIRTVTAPLVSMRAAWEAGYPALAVLSGFISFSLIVPLVWIVAPIVFSAIASSLPAIMTQAITVLATPFTKLAALVAAYIDLTIPVVIAALITVLGSVGILRGIYGLASTKRPNASCVEGREAMQDENNGENIPQNNNVVDFFPKKINEFPNVVVTTQQGTVSYRNVYSSSTDPQQSIINEKDLRN